MKRLLDILEKIADGPGSFFIACCMSVAFCLFVGISTNGYWELRKTEALFNGISHADAKVTINLNANGDLLKGLMVENGE